ncbi:hypothetical protein PBRA_001865 [Plasmodiophora brassicae]|nr:hypothetical protein PBRA_001865 [Plasmodiophora brassicae]
MFAVEQPRQTARGHAFRRFTNRRLLWHCGTRLTNLQLVLNGTFSIADAFQDVLSDDIIHMSRNRAVLALCEIADDSSGTFTKEIRSRSMPQRPNTSIVNVNDETQLSITTDDCCPASALPEISRITVADAGQIRLRFIVTVRRSGL